MQSEVGAAAGSCVMAVELVLLLSFLIREFRDPSTLHVGERGRQLLLIQGRIIASSVAL